LHLLVFGVVFVVANSVAMPNGVNEFLLLRLVLKARGAK
jgi:hypothetical protein